MGEEEEEGEEVVVMKVEEKGKIMIKMTETKKVEKEV